MDASFENEVLRRVIEKRTAELSKERDRVNKLCYALDELLNSIAVEFDDPRLHYVEAQIDREAIEDARKVLAEKERSK